MTGICRIPTPSEIQLFMDKGAERQIVSERLGLKSHRISQNLTDLQSHQLGIFGEGTVMIVLGIKQDFTINTFRSIPDVGPYEVRTSSIHWYDMIIRPDDKLERVFIACTCEYFPAMKDPTVWVRGYIVGKHAKEICTLEPRGGYAPAWFVKQSQLKPIQDLLP